LVGSNTSRTDSSGNLDVTPIAACANPTDIVISPDGSTAYVTCWGGGVDVLKTATNTVSATIAVSGASGEAITPDGQTLYPTDTAADEVKPITTATNAVVVPIALCSTTFDPAPLGIVITPDDSSAYVASSNAVWPIDLAIAIVGSPISASATLTSGGTAILIRFGIAIH
jgi:DNA-binding beta-propeller fold protein YncE